MTRESEILGVYKENINAVFSINEISKQLGKAYPYTNKKVNELIDAGILKMTAVGRSHLCSLNLENQETIMLLALQEINKHKTIPKNTLEQARTYEKNHPDTQTIIYNPKQEELLIVTSKPTTNTITTQELQQRILTDETLYKERIVITGYQRFFQAINTPAITRRYHPLL